MEEVLRKEIKYVISVMDFYRIRQQLSAIMQLDVHSGYDGYEVRSLYFDSLQDQDVHDTLSGYSEKRKIRLRTYDVQSAQVKLEYKCKSNMDGLKKSITLTKEQAMDMMQCDYWCLSQMGTPLALELYTRMMSGGYTPKSMVRYNRLAYVYPISNVRVTFDTNIATTWIPESFLDAQAGLFPLLPSDIGVLEVKYNAFLPGIIKDIVSKLEPIQVSNSKYVQSRLLY